MPTVEPQNFTLVSNRMLDDKSLSGIAKLVGAMLYRLRNRYAGAEKAASVNGQFFYGNENLMELCGIKDPRTLRKALKELEQGGYIKRKVAPIAPGSTHLMTWYTVFF